MILEKHQKAVRLTVGHLHPVLGKMVPVTSLPALILLQDINFVDQLDVLVTVMDNQKVILSVLLTLVVLLLSARLVLSALNLEFNDLLSIKQKAF